MPAIDSVDRSFTRVNIALSYICAAIVVFMTVSIIYDVLARLLFKAPTIWVIDINEYLLVYLTFLPAAWILMHDRHVKVELLTSRLVRPQRLRLAFITDILACAYCMILAWQGWIVAWEALQRGYEFSTALAFPRFPVIVIIPVGAAWLALAFMIRLWANARR
jgi:TRAP-type C4-dicarboxylate transport system permease small subunit